MCSASNQISSPVTTVRPELFVVMNWLTRLFLMAFLLGLCPAQADELDEQYLQIYTLVQQADDLNANGKRDPAKSKYLEAYTALRAFKKSYPDWNVKTVSFRLKYLEQKLTALSEPPAAAGGGAATNNAPEAKTEVKAATPTSSGPLKLLAAGAEPRTALRLHPKSGDKQTLHLTAKVALETKMGDVQPPPIKLPSTTATLEIPVDITVQEVSAKGDIIYEVALGDVSAGEAPAGGGAAPAAKARKSPLGGVKGTTATGTVSSHGVSKGLDFKAPPDADPQTRLFLDLMKDVFVELVTPLPEEAAGTGAKWEVKAPSQSHGIKVDQTANYELVSVEGDTLKIRSTCTQRAASQKIDNPIMPGMKVDLTKWTAKGSSELELDAGKIMPSSGTMELHSEMSLGLNLGGQNQGLTMKMDVNLQLEGK